MLPITGQTGGPNGLKLFVDTHGWLGVLKAKKSKKNSQHFFPRATPGPSASLIYNSLFTIIDIDTFYYSTCSYKGHSMFLYNFCNFLCRRYLIIQFSKSSLQNGGL